MLAGGAGDHEVAARREFPIVGFVGRRVGLGLITILAVSIIVFMATQILPGNAAYAILGRSATPAGVHQLEHQLHLNRSPFSQYWSWISGVLQGHFGTSLANGNSVSSVVGSRFENSAVLVIAAGVIGTVLGLLLGTVAAFRRDSIFDHGVAFTSLVVTALPEFVIAIALVLLFATEVTHILPAISLLPPGTTPLTQPEALVLPTATLVLVITPYIARMMRAAMIESLESDYVEMAHLAGIPNWRILFRHALPNALAPTIQVIGLNFLYLAGGIVVVEYVFDYPGIGQGLVSAVSNRDVPVIQLIVVVLAAVYVLVNIATDVTALVVTPRRRYARS